MRASPLRAALLALAVGAAPFAAASGAWTRPPGETFLSVSSSTYRTDDDSYEEVYTALYAEHGLREGLTLGGALEFSQPTGPAAPLDDRLTVSAFARFRLHEGAAGDPVSVQIGAIYAGGGFDAGVPLQREGDGLDVDLRGLYGRGFATGWGDAFVDAQAAFRARTGEPADELRLDVTLGLRPDAAWLGDRWLLMAQSFGVLSLRNEAADGDGYDSLKLAPTIGYRIGPGLMVGLGAERDVVGRGTEPGLRLKAFMWKEF